MPIQRVSQRIGLAVAGAAGWQVHAQQYGRSQHVLGAGHEAVTFEDREVVLPLHQLAFVIHQSVVLHGAGRRAAVEEHLQQVV